MERNPPSKEGESEMDFVIMRNKRAHQSTEEDASDGIDIGPKASSKKDGKHIKKKVVSQQRVVAASNDIVQTSSPAIQSDQVILNRKDFSSDRGKQTRYDAFTRAPYIIHVRLVSGNNKESKQLPLIAVAKKLNSANVKFTNILKYSFNTWKMTLATKTLANNVLSNGLLRDMGFVAFIPRYKISRQVVIREIPLDFSLTDLKEIIEKENANVVISRMFRLRSRDRSSNQFVDTQSVCLEIRGEGIPQWISILKTTNAVYPYVPAVRMCYNCGRFGHISRTCEKVEKCLTCAGTTGVQEMPPALWLTVASTVEDLIVRWIVFVRHIRNNQKYQEYGIR